MFWLGVAVLYAVVVVYFCTENAYWHKSRAIETWYWMVVTFLSSMLTLLSHDTPWPLVYLNTDSRVLAIVFSVTTTLITRYYHKKARMKRLQKVRVGYNTGNHLVASDGVVCAMVVETPSALEKAASVTMRLDSLTTSLSLSQASPRSWRGRNRDLPDPEAEIVEILRQSNETELNYILTNVNIGKLCSRVRDHRRGMYNRTTMMNLLTVHRISHIQIIAKAALVYGIQQVGLRAHQEAPTWIRRILLSENTLEGLSLLKCLIDSNGGYQTLHKLIYDDLHSEDTIQRQILLRLRSLSDEQAPRNGTMVSRQLKIMSDLDDTLKSSGGQGVSGRIAGVDRRFPKGVIYPGVLSLFRELDLGPRSDGDGQWDSSRCGNLVFISARPHLYKDVSESKSYEMFQGLLDVKKLHAIPTLLPGSISSAKMLIGDLKPMGQKKLQNITEYWELYREADLIFFGDNGQADAYAAVQAMEWSKQISDRERPLRACFLHQVQAPVKTYLGEFTPKTDDEVLAYLSQRGVYLFSSYIEAATMCYRLGMINVDSLFRVAKDASKEFTEITFSSATARDQVRQEMNRHIRLVNTHLSRTNTPMVIDEDWQCPLIP